MMTKLDDKTSHLKLELFSHINIIQNIIYVIWYAIIAFMFTQVIKKGEEKEAADRSTRKVCFDLTLN